MGPSIALGREKLVPALAPVLVLADNKSQERRLFNIASNRYLMASEPENKASAWNRFWAADAENAWKYPNDPKMWNTRKAVKIVAMVIGALAGIYLANRIAGFDFFSQADRQNVARDFARAARENWGVLGSVVEAIGGFWVLALNALAGAVGTFIPWAIFGQGQGDPCAPGN
ncbi:MAG: hypothetical protein WC717_04700 [Candidatus Micrarchaeia archaeon]